MHLHDDDGRDVIPPIPYQSPQNFTPPPLYYPPLKPKSKKGRNILIAVAAFVVLIVIAAIASSPKNTGTPTASATTTSTTNNAASADPTPVTNASDPLAVGAPSTAAAAPVTQQVVYSCTGRAPDGVDITYGADGSSHSATKLPFNHSDPLESTALYYNVTAQLQGGGSVSCTTTVTYDDGSGTAQTVTKTGSADGDYNIASAEICTGFDSSYIAC